MQTLLCALLILASAAASGYSQAQKPGSTPAKTPRLTSQEKLKLLSIGAVGGQTGPSRAPMPGAQASPAKPAKVKSRVAASGRDSGVSEFQTVSQDFNGSGGALTLPAKGSKKSMLKNVHGELGGTMAPGMAGSHQTDAAVGGTSKSGKTSVFVATHDAKVQGPR